MALEQEKFYTEEDYWNTPEDVRVELIDGKFYDLASPNRLHQTILGGMYATIYNYLKAKGGSCSVYPAPFAVKLFENRGNIVEPDISVICDPSKLTKRGCTGAPDWIIEIISPSNSSHDYVRKLSLYADAGVREYWIVDPRQESIFVYYLEKESFKAEAYTFQDKLKVNIYDDFQIDFQELDL